MKKEAAIWERVDALKPWTDNPRKNKGAIEHVAESIKRFGFASPIIARAEDKTIIAGHTRFEAAKKLGLDSVPVRYLDLDPADSRLLALADNKIGEIAEWDEEKLEKVMQELLEEGLSLDGLGWDDDELSKIVDELKQEEIEEDEVPEADEEGEPDSKLGEVYELGEHRLICGDSTLSETWDKLMQGERADMVFTDPPYGMFLDTDYTKIKGSKLAKIKGGGKKYKKVIGDHNDFKPELITSILNIFSSCKEIFLWGADYYSEYLKDKNNGSWIVWDKRGSEDADKIIGSCFELCWSKQKHKREIARFTWIGAFGQKDAKNRIHPTQKPIKLVRWFFDRYGKEEDIIVDGYGGSGSTLIAAAQTKRRARLVELDPKYCDVIRRRWTQYAKDHDLDVGTGGLE